jgi:hypothetical protein
MRADIAGHVNTYIDKLLQVETPTVTFIGSARSDFITQLSQVRHEESNT